jgi:hypothetical protein
MAHVRAVPSSGSTAWAVFPCTKRETTDGHRYTQIKSKEVGSFEMVFSYDSDSFISVYLCSSVVKVFLVQ